MLVLLYRVHSMTRYLRNNSQIVSITDHGMRKERFKDTREEPGRTVYSSVCSHGVCDAIGAYFARVTSFA